EGAGELFDAQGIQGGVVLAREATNGIAAGQELPDDGRAEEPAAARHQCRHAIFGAAGLNPTSLSDYPPFWIAARSTLRPSALSGVGFCGFISYSRLMQPWKPTSLSALTTAGTSSAPCPTITSTRRSMLKSFRCRPKLRWPISRICWAGSSFLPSRAQRRM